jgi:photosystem II stability/assembly factor-like uncharacterized protein
VGCAEAPRNASQLALVRFLERRSHVAHCAALMLGAFPAIASAQVNLSAAVPSTLHWRNIGPNRGGRSIAAAGSSLRPLEYYFGATGGGLWKTTDGGINWSPVTDGQIRSSSPGAVAVAPSNPDVVYMGMGEAELRASVIQGDGVYRSIDAGKTWKNIGLRESQAIARIVVDPSNPDIVYVAALGHPYGKNAERGIFRSRDGGSTWQKILYRDDHSGAVDIALDMSNPRVLYASLWDVYRRPWTLSSGGPGSGLFKSSDGGDTWTEITRNQGMPSGVIGKITIAVSPADSRRIYANVEAVEGGLYRSDDSGVTWSRINNSRDLWQRSFYFMRAVADPHDRDVLYVLNFKIFKSSDGGKTFREVVGTHDDNHDLWIDPLNPSRMINANDGGASITTNGGATWTGESYPTAQVYRVATTADVPYHVCGGQQDDGSVCVSSGSSPWSVPDTPAGGWFYDVGGGEDAVIAPDPSNADVFYSNETNSLTRFDRRSGALRDVQPYPRLVMGEPAKAMPERWNWTYPIAFSQVDKKTLYAGSQHLWRTRDEGRTWSVISPDLTRNDSATLGDSGGPIIFDQDGPEIYGTVFTIAPSPRNTRVIWTGSDDGLVHVTTDGGAMWRDVTPPDARAFTRMSRIDASPHADGTAYVAGNRYQMDDRAPYIWKTTDFGKTWKRITTGIRGDDFVHAVREDPVRKGLLYAGTEHGVYVSFDDGAAWESLSLNLPDVPVSDLVVKNNDVVIATHGRSFYVLDDVAPLRETGAKSAKSDTYLYEPAAAIRRVTPARIDYFLKDPAQALSLEVLSDDGKVIRTLRQNERARLAGYHRVTWDLRHDGATVFPGIVLEGPSPATGPWAVPGHYRVRLTVDGKSVVREVRVLPDPRTPGVSIADMRAQNQLALRIRDAITRANSAVIRIRSLKSAGGSSALLDSLSSVESALYQVRNQSPKDKIAFPIRLNNRLSGLLGNLERGDGMPTRAYYKVFDELAVELNTQMHRMDSALAGTPHGGTP